VATAHAQCYDCAYQKDEKNRTYFGPNKVLKKYTSETKKVNWYNCQNEIFYGVQHFGDSSITYIFSPEKKYLGKETRYFVSVPPFLAEKPVKQPANVNCPGPAILPLALWPLAAKIYQLDNLDTLNYVDGMEFWVCDMYKVEVPEDHIVAQKEGTTIFYVVNMDFVFHFFNAEIELEHIGAATEYHPSFYLHPELYYETYPNEE